MPSLCEGQGDNGREKAMTEKARRLVVAFKAKVEAIEPEERMQVLLAVMPWTSRAYKQAQLDAIEALRKTQTAPF